MDTIPSGWGVREGALTRVRPAADIITTEKFKNFELTLEWNVSPKGNSGIFYRASEDPDDDAIYWSAPEMQVLDDAGHPDGHRLRLRAVSLTGRRREARGPVECGAPGGERQPRRALAQRREGRRVRAGEPGLGGEGQGEQVRHPSALRP